MSCVILNISLDSWREGWGGGVKVDFFVYMYRVILTFIGDIFHLGLPFLLPYIVY